MTPRRRTTIRLFAAPAGGAGAWTTGSVGALELLEDGRGHVTGSRRVLPLDAAGGDSAVSEAFTLASAVVEEQTRTLSARVERSGARVQTLALSASTDAADVLEGRWELSLTARLETVAGATLLGAFAEMPLQAAAAALEVPPGDLPAAVRTAPRGWEELPVLLAPPVVAAAALVLADALAPWSDEELARRLLGKRFLPDGFGVRSEPLVEATALDDEAVPVAACDLVRGGRTLAVLTGAAAARRLGVEPAGRARWSHEAQRLENGVPARVRLTAPHAGRVPAVAVELVRCVEGLRRVRPDGRLALACLARVVSEGAPVEPPFVVELAGSPVRLLRSAYGAGNPVAAFSSGHAEAPELVLPSARTLRELGCALEEAARRTVTGRLRARERGAAG